MKEKQLKILKLGMNECGVSVYAIDKFYEISPISTLKYLVKTGYLTLVSPGVYKTTEQGKDYVLHKMNYSTEQSSARAWTEPKESPQRKIV